MMQPTVPWTERLKRMILDLGPAGRKLRAIRAATRELHLKFQPLQAPTNSIWWDRHLPLDQLLDLPKNALSGPVQEDKAAAHQVLSTLIRLECQEHDVIDLRQIDGLCAGQHMPDYPSLEALADSPLGKQHRIISYKDFIQTLSLAIPGHAEGTAINLCASDWSGHHLYWSSQINPVAFGCAVVYARRRNLAYSLPACIRHYGIRPAGLLELERRYYSLSLPRTTWKDEGLIRLLIEGGIPYARLSLSNPQSHLDLLLLPRTGIAEVLGETLYQQGAAELSEHLKKILEP